MSHNIISHLGHLILSIGTNNLVPLLLIILFWCRFCDIICRLIDNWPVNSSYLWVAGMVKGLKIWYGDTLLTTRGKAPTEHLDMSMKTIDHMVCGPYKAVVQFDKEWEEYRVDYYFQNATHLSQGTYFTDDRQDARDTAILTVQRYEHFGHQSTNQ